MSVLNWASGLVVTVGGTNRTADLCGAGKVDCELDAAGIAEFRLRGTMPAVGATVSIAGIVAETWLGVVDRVEYDPDPARQHWVVYCTDGLQALFEGLGAASVAAGLPVAALVVAALPSGALWHSALFAGGQDAEDGWEAAKDAMSTIPASIWLKGGTLRSASWAGTGAGTVISHVGGSITDGSLRIRVASSRELVRQVIMRVTLRYTRLHQWTHDFGWSIPDWDFCDWIAYPHSLPTRDLIAEAVAGNVWATVGSGGLSVVGDGRGIATDGLPESGTYGCGVWSLTPDGALACIAANWSGVRRWAQTITETYTLTVTGTGASGAVVNDEAGFEAPGDDGSWDGSRGTELPGSGWSGSGHHRWLDQIDSGDRAAILAGAAQLCATRIRRSQRGNTLGCGVLPGTEPALGARASILADREGAGQVAQVVTTWDVGSRLAGCQVTLILCDGSTSGDALGAASAPDVSPSAAGYTLGDSTALGTHIGGLDGCPEQDDEWTGWVGNAQLIYPSSNTYEEGFALVTPDVPDGARDEQAGLVSAAYAVAPLTGTLGVPA